MMPITAALKDAVGWIGGAAGIGGNMLDLIYRVSFLMVF